MEKEFEELSLEGVKFLNWDIFPEPQGVYNFSTGFIKKTDHTVEEIESYPNHFVQYSEGSSHWRVLIGEPAELGRFADDFYSAMYGKPKWYTTLYNKIKGLF